jgi:hypothetical protein
MSRRGRKAGRARTEAAAGSVRISSLFLPVPIFCASSVQLFRVFYVLVVRTAELSLRSSNNAYFLPLIFFCPENKIQVMSAVPGSEILGSYRRIYDKTYYTTNNDRPRSVEITALAMDLAYAPGQPDRFCRFINLNQKTRFDFLRFSRRLLE